MNFKKLLFNPYSFFGELSSEAPDIKCALIIVLLTGYFGAGMSFIAARNILPANTGLAPVIFDRHANSGNREKCAPADWPHWDIKKERKSGES